jgi:hypothetical protein
MWGFHRCPCAGCEKIVPRLHTACSDCWRLVPKWLQQKIVEERQYGTAWKCHPTDDFLKLRTQLVEIVNRTRQERHARPEPSPQLSLLPTT